MSDSKLDLIAKLLAKAESTTPAEAEALTEHAERLMMKYGIEQARIDERRARLGQSQEQIVQKHKVFAGVYGRDLRETGIYVTTSLGTLRALQADIKAGSVLYVVGFESDVDQALVLISSLEVQGMVAMRSWWASHRDLYRWESESTKRRARSGFLRGFGVGAASRIRENRKAIVEEAGSGTDLVLASRRDRVDAHVDGTQRRTARSRKPADAQTFAEGHRAGREANTGEKSLENTLALAAGVDN